VVEAGLAKGGLLLVIATVYVTRVINIYLYQLAVMLEKYLLFIYPTFDE